MRLIGSPGFALRSDADSSAGFAGSCACNREATSALGRRMTRGCSSEIRLDPLEGAATRATLSAKSLSKVEEKERTLEGLVPLLYALHRIVVPTQRSRRLRELVALRLIRLPFRRHHPRMPQQLPRRDPEVPVLLEALEEEVSRDRRSSFWDGRTVVIDDAEEGRHGVEEVVRRFAGDEFDDESS